MEAPIIRIIITGASRGFGREVALAFAKSIRSGVHFTLASRDLSGLETTRTMIQSERDGIDAETQINLVAVDLMDLSQVQERFDSIFSLASAKYSKVIFVDNAGVLGHLGPVGDSNVASAEALSTLVQAITCNVTSSFFMTSELLRAFDAYRQSNPDFTTKLVIVDVSSLCAIQPFEHFGTYCASKAARDMFYRVFAAERTSAGDTGIRVLNYAPGPMDTAMADTIVRTPNATQEAFISMREKNQFVPTAVSASKLVKLVNWESFESGAHVDYFDPNPTGPGWSEPTSCCACTDCSCGVDCACKKVGKRLCDSCGRL